MDISEVKHLLVYIGFTSSEASVYLALLDLGLTTTGPIIKQAGISQGKVYVILDRLLNKGIVTYTIKSGTKHFQAKDPQTLLVLFEKIEQEVSDKKKNLLAILPQLKAKHDSMRYEKQVEIYEGFKAMKMLYTLLLEKGKKMFIIGATASIPRVIEEYFMSWHKKRIEKKIYIQFIYGEERKKYASNREDMPYTDVRYLDLPVSPSWTTVVEDYVVTVTMIDEKNITCFLIKNATVAKSQREYFGALWKQAKKAKETKQS